MPDRYTRYDPGWLSLNIGSVHIWFWQILPPVSIERPPPPDDVSICQTRPPPPPPPPPSHFKVTSFLKNPLHSTLIETLNVYLIQLKTERCQVNFMWIIILGDYINAVVFLLTSARLRPPPPLSSTVSILKPPLLLTSYVNAPLV